MFALLSAQGFRKVNPDRWEFAHESFLTGQKHLLKNIKRRRPSSSSKHHHHLVESRPPRTTATTSVCLGQQQQQSDEVQSLKRDRASLLAELAALRQRYGRCMSLLAAMEDRVRDNERKQQLIVAFVARVLTNPDFLRRLLLNRAARNDDDGERQLLCAKRQRLMVRASSSREEQQQLQLVASTMENGCVEAMADVSEGSGSGGGRSDDDGGAVKHGRPVLLAPEEWDGQSCFDDDVWEELGAIPGAEVAEEREVNIAAAASFDDVEEFTGRPCGWVDDCPYLVDPMPFVEY